MQKLLTKREDFEILKESGADLIGYGALSQVHKVRLKANGKIYALKEMDLKQIHPNDIKNIQREIKTQMYLDHPNIVHLYDSIQTPDNVLLLLLEYADNNNLFHFIQGRPLDEKVVHKFFFQTVQAIEYIHKRKIMHRDLKPENILLDKNYNVKVCDFGWCAEYNEQERRQTFCGTSEYMAPEIIDSRAQDPSIDIWSLGILLYEMYHKRAPYRGNNPHEILKDIKRRKLTFTEPRMCPEARDLIEKILVVDPKRRITIEEIYKHPYFYKFPFFRLDSPDPKQLKSSRRSYVASPSSKGAKFEFKQEPNQAQRVPDKNVTSKPAGSSNEGSSGFNLIKVISAQPAVEAQKSGLGGNYTDSSKVLPGNLNGKTGNNPSSNFNHGQTATTTQSSIQTNALSQSLVFQNYSNPSQNSVSSNSYNLSTLVPATSIQSGSTSSHTQNPSTSGTLISGYSNFGATSIQPVNLPAGSTLITQVTHRQEQQTYSQANSSLNQSQQRISGNSVTGIDHNYKIVEPEGLARRTSDEDKSGQNGNSRRISNNLTSQPPAHQANPVTSTWKPLVGAWQPPTFSGNIAGQTSHTETREVTTTKKTYDAPTYTSSFAGTTSIHAAHSKPIGSTWTSYPSTQQSPQLISSPSNLNSYTQVSVQRDSPIPVAASSGFTWTAPQQTVSTSSNVTTTSYQPAFQTTSYTAGGYPGQQTTTYQQTTQYVGASFPQSQQFSAAPGQAVYTTPSALGYGQQTTTYYPSSQHSASQPVRTVTPVISNGNWTRSPAVHTSGSILGPQAPSYVLSPSAVQTTYSVIQR